MAVGKIVPTSEFNLRGGCVGFFVGPIKKNNISNVRDAFEKNVVTAII